MKSNFQILHFAATLIGFSLFSLGANAQLPTGVYPISEMHPVADNSDLAPFDLMVKDADIVALGESDHGSGGFHEIKYRLIRELVEQKGFRTIILETNYGDAKVASQFVATCQGTPGDALKGLFAIWQDGVDQSLLEWLCAFNSTHTKDPVQFLGIDIQEPWNQAKILTSFINKEFPSQSSSLIGRLANCLGFSSKSSDDFHNS